VFPQDGLTNYPGTDELLVEGLKRGAEVIGGAPRYETDPAGQIRRVFELAREYDVDIDLHLDVGNSPGAMHIHYVCELTDDAARPARGPGAPPRRHWHRRYSSSGGRSLFDGARPGSQRPPWRR